MLAKILLCLCALLLVDASVTTTPNQPVLKKTFHNDFFDRLLEQDENLASDDEGGAIVLKSNLPAAIQARLAGSLTSIYQTTSDKLQRAQHFQTALSQTYSVYWNVVINFDVITFYSQYYILLQINGDRVLGFGLN